MRCFQDCLETISRENKKIKIFFFSSFFCNEEKKLKQSTKKFLNIMPEIKAFYRKKFSEKYLFRLLCLTAFFTLAREYSILIFFRESEQKRFKIQILNTQNKIGWLLFLSWRGFGVLGRWPKILKIFVIENAKCIYIPEIFFWKF